MAFTTQRYLISNLVNADNITASSQGAGTIRQPKKTGTGTTTMTPSGSYTGASNLSYIVQCDLAGSVDGAATFKWKTSESSGWEATGVSATTSATSLSNGVNVTFSAGTLVLNDKWQFPVYAEYGPGKLFVNDRDSFWKSGAINTNLLSNGDFEDGFTAGLADDWTQYGAGQTYAEETGTVHTAGGSAQKVTVVNDANTIGIYQAITVTDEDEYYVEAWVYVNQTSNVVLSCSKLGSGPVTEVTATTWTKLTWYATATSSGATNFYIYQGAGACGVGDYIIIDDVKIVALAYLDIDLGSAQTPTAIALLDFNFSSDATIILKGNSSETWASPGYEKDDFVVSSDPIIEYDGDTYQYWRWVFEDIDQSDEFHSVGKLYLGTYSELTGNLKNIPWGSTKSDTLQKTTNRAQSGKANGHVYARFKAFETKYFPTRTSGDLTTLETIWEATFDVSTGQCPSILINYFYDESTTLHFCRCVTEDNPTEYTNYAHYGIALQWEEEVITRTI
jgi:hypothetical protein